MPKMTEQEKIAAVHDAMYQEVFVPEFVATFNKLASDAGVALIRTEADLDRMLKVADVIADEAAIEQSRDSEMIKSASDRLFGNRPQPSNTAAKFASRPEVVNLFKQLAT